MGEGSTILRMAWTESEGPAASEDPEAYPLGYVEDLNDARTKLEDFFNILPEETQALAMW